MKKKLNKIGMCGCILLMCMMLFVPCKTGFAASKGKCGKKASWVYNKGTITISGKGKMYNYKQNKNYPWKKYRTKIKKVVIEKGITSVGNYAFYECKNLKSFSASNTVKEIGKNAFCGIAIKGVLIPDYINKIGDGAFKNCKKIERIVFQNGVTEIGADAFASCSNLRNEIIIPQSVKSIGDGAFAYCKKLKKVTIENEGIRYGTKRGVFSIGYKGKKDKFGLKQNPNLILYGYNGSTTATYAKRYGIKFKDLIGATKVILKEAYRYDDGKTKIRWAPIKSGDGYAVQISEAKDFSSGTYQWFFSNIKKSQTNIVGLDMEKTYFVRVCVYKKVDGDMLFGKWSNVMQVERK